MNQKMKKLLACLLAFVMVVLAVPFSAVAAEDDGMTIINESKNEPKAVAESAVAESGTSGTWGGIDWTLTTDGTLTIAPTKGEPTQLANKKTAFKVGEWPEAVRYNSKGEGAAIEGWPYDRTAVKKLVIEEGVTSIGSFAAQGFTNLTGEVVIPSTVTYIGQEAFQFSTMEKLTFAQGGTENLTIAQGALKNLIIEEIEFPADRPAIYLKAWVLNNNDNLKSVTLPANVVSMSGTNQVDYLYFSTSHNSGNYSQLTHYNDKLDTIEFGSEEVKAMFFTTCGNPITTIGVKGNHKTAPTVASVGLTFCTSLAAAVEAAQPGDTITLLKNTDEAVEIPAGVTLDKGEFTAPGVTVAKPSVAQIGENTYATLAEALAAAQAGDTITFLADITEDITISKAITIDGAGKTYTGAMELKADTTIKNVNFDGKGYNGYAITTRGAQYLTIEDCTAKNYGYGFVQLASATALTTVKNVTVSNVNYGVKIDYYGAVVLENVDITAGAAAVLNSNYGGKTITVKNSKLNILGTWTRNNTIKTNYVFEGANTIDSFIIDAAIDTFKLAAGATLTAPNDITATTDAKGGKVLYENGAYYVKLGLVGSGTEADPYQIGSVEDLVMFRDSVNAGETRYNTPGVYVALTADIDLAGIDWSVNIGDDCNATFDGIFDGKGHTIKNLTSTETAQKADGYICAGLFGAIYGEAVIKNLTIENVTINTGDFTGNNASAVVGFAYNATGSIENVTVKGNIQINANKVDGVGAIVGYAYGGKLTVKNCKVDGAAMTRSASAVNGQAYVGGIIGYAGGKVALCGNTTQNVAVNASSCAAGGVAGIILGGGVASDNTVKNVTMTSAHANWQNAVGAVAGTFTGSITVSGTVAEDNSTNAIVGVLHADKPTAPLGKAQAAIGNIYYGTFADAYAAAKAGDTITLLAPIVVAKGETLTLDKDVTITYTSDVVGEDMITVRGTLNVAAGKITYVNNSNGSNVTVSTISAEPGSVVNVTGGIIENKTVYSTGSYAYAIDMLTNGSLGDVTVTISGGKVYSDYMAIRQFNNGTACKNSLTVTGGEIYGAKRAIQIHMDNNAAVLSISGGKIEAGEGGYALCLFPENATNIAITGGKFIGTVYSGTNGIISGGTYSNEIYAGYIKDGLVLSKNADGTYGIATPVASVNGVDYATLAEAIKAATAGSTITLLTDVNENVTINKNLIIDGADKNYTGTMTINNVTVTIENVNFVKGQVYKHKSTGSTAKITIKNCNFDGQGMDAYAINLGGTGSIVIENVTAKDYGYGLLQVPSSCAGLTVKNVTVNGCYYGLKVDYANAVTIENANIDATVGIYDSNFGTKTYTIKNSAISSLKIWERNTTNYTTFKFEGVNTVATLATSAYAKYTGVQVGNKIYDSLAEAFAAAQNGDTVKLLGNIATSETITIADGKKITLDMNGKKITVTDNATKNYELFYIYGEMIVTGNGTIELTSTNNRAWNAMSAIFHNRGGVLTIENGTFKNLGGTDMAWVVDNSGNWYGDATTVINGGTLTSTYTAIRNRMEQNTHGASGKAILVINGGTIDGTTSAIWAQAASTSTVAPATGSITVNGGNVGLINTARSAGADCMTTINGGTVAGFKGETGELTVNGGKITGTITICHDNDDVAKYKVVKDGVYYAAVAKVGVKYYATLQEAIDACSNGGKVTLVDNAKGPGVVINKDITINFANYTYTLTEGVGSTGTESNGFQILAGNKVTLSAGTLKVAEEAADKFYILIQNYADLSCFNMNLDGTYLDKWSKTDGDSYVISNNSGYISLTGKTYITTNDDGDKAFAFDACDSKYYADKPIVFAATTVKIDGKAVSESYDKIEAAARIGSTQFFAALKDAFAYASNGNTIKLMADVTVSEGITNTGKVTLDLNGKTVTGTDNATGSFAIITNKGQLTITGNGKITLTATNNRGWNAYSSVISNTVGGKLIVESGTIEHLGGTDMAYAIDNLTNGKGTYAETIINGGTIKSTYRAIRMFLNGVEADNILTVKGGTVEGANKAIWMQDPSKNANTGKLTVTAGATINGDVYLTVTEGSTEWPVTVSVAASAVNGEVLTSNVPESYKLVNTKGVYSVEKVKVYIAQVGVTKYESLQAAIDACPAGGKVTLLRDAKGPGVVINKNITILFNGHTYTITDPVGSAGTETLGFQILKGNTVVLNNGKIEIAEEAANKFAILIQNYGNLTVFQMTLDGTNLGRYENYSYVLSVNCGKVTVNGKSVLTAKDGEGNYALDVYDYSSAGYSLPTVTVTTVVKINGKINAGAKYSTGYYATVEQAKAANPGKKVTVLN